MRDGSISFFLDIHHNGKRWTEFITGKRILPLPEKDRKAIAQLRQANKETLAELERIRANTETNLIAADYDETPKNRRNVDFLKFYEDFAFKKYQNKDKRLVISSYRHFRDFLTSQGYTEPIFQSNKLTEDICKKFKYYLDSKFNGETPYNYFAKFKRVTRQAVKDKILKTNPTEFIENKKKDGIKKSILSIDEVALLAKTDCGNNDVKRAFLFSLNTGLRFCDIVNLRWNNIDNDKLIYTQTKTKNSNYITLNKTALKILGNRAGYDERIFKLPSFTACLKDLRQWTSKAGIEKKITWHSARHSFAVNVLTLGADIKTVSGLLGHASLKHTEKYTRFIDELKIKAVNSLPELELE